MHMYCLAGAVAENALVGSKYRLAPSAGLPATTLSAAAEQVAAILVAKSVDRGLYYRTIPRSDPNFASGQLQVTSGRSGSIKAQS